MYDDKKNLILKNCGIGPAIITEIVFIRNGKKANNIKELLDFSYKFKFDTYWSFREEKYYLAPGQKYKILELTKDNLSIKSNPNGEYFDKDKSAEIMHEYEKQLREIRIEMVYTDIFNNQQYTNDKSKKMGKSYIRTFGDLPD